MTDPLHHLPKANSLQRAIIEIDTQCHSAGQQPMATCNTNGMAPCMHEKLAVPGDTVCAAQHADAGIGYDSSCVASMPRVHVLTSCTATGWQEQH
jgi:hypothetical protein